MGSGNRKLYEGGWANIYVPRGAEYTYHEGQEYVPRGAKIRTTRGRHFAELNRTQYVTKAKTA